MDLAAALGIFLVCVAGCMAGNLSLSWALAAGFVCFFWVGLHRGQSARAMLRMAAEGMVTAMKVLRILMALGLLTALWRSCGTVAFFVRMGVTLITPSTFILIAFLLPAVFSLAFGSSFGVVGTAGVILMTIARSGGADLTVTAGAIMSGIYVGERLSPASSSAALTAAVCGVDQREFQLRMWRTTPLALGLTAAVYGVLSVLFPIRQVDAQIVAALEEGFRLTWPTVLPAAALLLLPWLKVSALKSIVISCVLSALCALFVQGVPPMELLRSCVLGYQPTHRELADIMAGGGLISMANVLIIVILSCSYSGMFNGTGLLDPITDRVERMADRIGLFAAQVVVSFGTCALFCNQTVGIVMSVQLLERAYRRRELPPMELAANVGNTVINLAGLVPWAIASSVPLTTMGVGLSALPLSVYLYLLTLCCWRGAERRARGA